MGRPARLALPLLIAVGASVLGVAGCSTAADTPAALSADYSSVDGEYQTARADLTLPTGVAFPGHLPDTGDHYPPGMGTNSAQTFWLCAWLRDYLDSPPTDQDRAKAAAAQLPKFKDMDAYTKGLGADGRKQVDMAIQGAQSGDKQKPGTFTEQTCGGPFYSLADPKG